jgi:hypothetical protein
MSMVVPFLETGRYAAHKRYTVQTGSNMRSGLLTLLGLILSLATGLLSPGVAQDSRPPPTSFRGDFDPLVALTVVYGREPWNDSLASRRKSLEKGQDFIEPLYDVAYVEGGIDKHVVIATLSPRPRSQYNCHACSPMLGGAVFRRDGDMWRVESRGLEIEPGHAWFDGKHGRLALVRVGADRYGLLHQVDDVSGGYESMRASLIFGVDGVLASRLVVPPVQGPGPGSCGMPAQHLKVGILDSGAGSAVPAANAGTDSASGFYEIDVDALWNEARCEPVASGAGARSSGRACQRASRYRYRDGAYVQTDVEIDVCRQLPERTVDFRG